MTADINKLKELREQTGISLSLCKKALEEAHNNIDKAKKLLSAWGVEKVKDKINKITSQGAIISYVHHNHKIASMVELLCETDFVAANSEFLRLGQEIAMQIASTSAANVADLLEQEYIRDPGKKISDLVKEAIMKFGENIKISRFIKWELGV